MGALVRSRRATCSGCSRRCGSCLPTRNPALHSFAMGLDPSRTAAVLPREEIVPPPITIPRMSRRPVRPIVVGDVVRVGPVDETSSDVRIRYAGQIGRVSFIADDVYAVSFGAGSIAFLFRDEIVPVAASS